MKLIRDDYVEIIEPHKLTIDNTKGRLNLALVEKVKEETLEVVCSNFKDVEEYGDVIQVILDLARNNGIYPSEIEVARVAKYNRLGGFTKGVYLK